VKTVDNRIVKGLTILSVALGLSMLMLGGCKRDIQNNDAVKQGVMTYLAKRSDLVAMDVKVMSVSYHENQATATVRFQAKGNTAPGSGLTMQYVLERQGDRWNVKKKAAEGHGAAAMPQEGAGGSIGAMPGTMPPGHPAGGSIGAMPDTMPPGHPTVGSGGLPAGHPPIGSDKQPGKSQ
jgi:hypothetical protein